jgi:hypothetical protein
MLDVRESYAPRDLYDQIDLIAYSLVPSPAMGER